MQMGLMRRRNGQDESRLVDGDAKIGTTVLASLSSWCWSWVRVPVVQSSRHGYPIVHYRHTTVQYCMGGGRGRLLGSKDAQG
jgi:hypothetical protein